MPGQIIMSKDTSKIISIAGDEANQVRTSLVRDLVLTLAGQGYKVCLIDSAHKQGDNGPPSEIEPPRSRRNLVLYDLPLSYTANVICLGLDFIRLNGSGADHLAGTECYDFVIVNTPPELGEKTMSFCLSAGRLILIMNPVMPSLIKTYSLLKNLKHLGYGQVPWVLLNRVPEGIDPERLTRKFSDKCTKNFGLTLSYLGSIPGEPSSQEKSGNINSQGPGDHLHFNSATFNNFTQKLSLKFKPPASRPGPFDFWETSLASLIRDNITEIYGQIPEQEADSNSASDECEHDFLLDYEKLVHEETPRYSPDLDNKQKQENEPAGSRPEKHRSKSRPASLRIGIICTDESLRSLLEDMFREKGLETRNMMNEIHGIPDILICSMDKPDKRCLEVLKKNAGVPCIWLSQYRKFSPPWAEGLHLVQILEKPFSLENVYTAVGKASLNNA